MNTPPLIVEAAGSPVDEWVRVANDSMSRGACWRAGPVHVKHLPADFIDASTGIADLQAEAVALRWLDGRLVAPAVRAVTVEDSGDQWLVTETIDGVVGSRGEELGDIGIVAALLGSMLAELHGMPRGDLWPAAPADAGNDGLAARVEASLSTLDVDRLPDPYNRYQPDELFGFWTDAMPDAADGQHQVVCHGNPVLSHVVFGIEPNGRGPLALRGVLSPGALGVGDRHLDLVRAQLSIHHHYGAEAVFAFYDGYGSDVDLVRLDHAVLTHHLLSSRVSANDHVTGASS